MALVALFVLSTLARVTGCRFLVNLWDGVAGCCILPWRTRWWFS
jgi:hypothetical protein